MNILGIHYGHNATVAVLQDGKITFAISEERFNRLKNSNGFPHLALKYVYENVIKPQDVDFAVMTQQDIAGYYELKRHNFQSVRDFSASNIHFQRSYSLKKHLLSHLHFYTYARSKAGRLIHWFREKQEAKTKAAHKHLAELSGLPEDKILYCNHHSAHAYAAVPNLDQEKRTLIFTMDGEGDKTSSAVHIYHQGKLERVSTNPIKVSLGYLYSEITKLLGMIPNEHEFKVMGLAPYAKQERARKLYEKYKDLVVLNSDLEFIAKHPTNKLEFYFLEELYGQRFDTIAAFIQIFIEEKVEEWVKAWIKKTGISDIALSGGVFMNVKLNQRLAELPEVTTLFPMPSCADESTALGAAVFGYLQLCERNNTKIHLVPFQDLYLGNEYSDTEIDDFVFKAKLSEKYKVEKFTEEFGVEKKVAELLASHKVVARFAGRTEWGARALGNRSILAHPGDRDTVRVINEMIKNRDFWMPFAASVLEEDRDRYFVNPKNNYAPYMAITFSTKPIAQEHLRAAIHPYDFTCRPQMVRQSWNPGYHALISHFRSLTDIGSVLNTSFNLHGEPNVESPNDAVRTFENSGLEYLALGKYLISKK